MQRILKKETYKVCYCGNDDGPRHKIFVFAIAQ